MPQTTERFGRGTTRDTAALISRTYTTGLVTNAIGPTVARLAHEFHSQAAPLIANPPAKDDEAALLPTSLEEALSALRADDVLIEALGKDFVEWYTLVKDAELADVAANTAKFAATGLHHDAAVQKAWNSLYFEFV